MVALTREQDVGAYSCSTVLRPLKETARRERRMPESFLSISGGDVTPAYLEYASPLIGEVKAHARLIGL